MKTATGREPSSPPMQSIQIRTTFGDRIRDAFAKEIEMPLMDYAELELRVLTGQRQPAR